MYCNNLFICVVVDKTNIHIPVTLKKKEELLITCISMQIPVSVFVHVYFVYLQIRRSDIQVPT